MTKWSVTDLLPIFGAKEMDANRYEVKRLDHLGLVSSFCKEIGLKTFIDERLPKHSHRSHISNGTLLLAMILNGLGFVSRTLHMYPEYFAEKPTERLLGEGILPIHINDDALGRLLDDLYESGVSELYQELAFKVVQYLKLPCKSLNIDTTSFHLDGVYEQDIDASTIRITRGYSRDHRPDLNQVILQLVTENQAGIPLYMQACSGNSNDTKLFKKLVQSHLKSLKAAYQNQYFIGDAALYDQETLQTLSAAGQLFITRVPQKLQEAKEVIEQANQQTFICLGNGYSGRWYSSEYGGVPQRWLMVKSEQANKRANEALNKKIAKVTGQSLQDFKKICRQTFACERDALEAANQFSEAQEFSRIHDLQIIKSVQYKRTGRPSRTETGDILFFITGTLATELNLCDAAASTTGLFILSTNDLSETLSMQFLLDEYKSQQAVEKGFRFLKSPEFLVSSLFLKKPERIEALLMVMTCSLLIYASIEYLIRKKLIENNLFYPDMKKKPSQNPTARWVFFGFQGISVLLIDNKTELITNLTERHSVILDCLGNTYWKFYS